MKNDKLFEKAIYDIVNLIPSGRATSYGAVAKAIGYPNLSRMVGKVMGKCNSIENGIPAHRVVNSNGVLTARFAFGTGNEMQNLLEKEGVNVKNNRIVNWKKIFWDPSVEINL